MEKYLLIDFGASLVKAGLYDLASGRISEIKHYPACPNISKTENGFELSLVEVTKQFNLILTEFQKKLPNNIKGIYLCSQMHGFILLDKKIRPLTNYVSWKDERSLNLKNGESIFSKLQNELGDSFKQITGMKLRPGLPFVNAQTFKGIRECKMITLPEWFCLSVGEARNIIHETMLAGLGFYDINKRQISSELTKFAKKFCGINFKFNKCVKDAEVAGYWKTKKKKIPIFAGIGDHQCAILGAGNKKGETISVNIGTGSQVSVIGGQSENEKVEYRPYFENETLATLTHIPAGRALEEYLNILQEIYRSVSYNYEIWNTLATLEKEEILASTLEFDLAIFKSAISYNTGGTISNIDEGSLTLKNYLASLIRCLVKQYQEAVKIIDPDGKIKTIQLSGGVARKLPQIAQVLEMLTGKKVREAESFDETLIGLKILALKMT